MRRTGPLRKPSFREHIAGVNSAMRGQEAMFGDLREAKGMAKPAMLELGPKRVYTPRVNNGPTEAQVLKSVLAYLRRHPDVASVERSQSGLFVEGNRTIRVGFVGKLDVSGFMKRGARYFEIEVKKPGKKPTEAQAARIAKVKANGGISGFVTSIEETAALLNS